MFLFPLFMVWMAEIALEPFLVCVFLIQFIVKSKAIILRIFSGHNHCFDFFHQ